MYMYSNYKQQCTKFLFSNIYAYNIQLSTTHVAGALTYDRDGFACETHAALEAHVLAAAAS